MSNILMFATIAIIGLLVAGIVSKELNDAFKANLEEERNS